MNIGRFLIPERPVHRPYVIRRRSFDRIAKLRAWEKLLDDFGGNDRRGGEIHERDAGFDNSRQVLPNVSKKIILERGVRNDFFNEIVVHQIENDVLFQSVSKKPRQTHDMDVGKILLHEFFQSQPVLAVGMVRHRAVQGFGLVDAFRRRVHVNGRNQYDLFRPYRAEVLDESQNLVVILLGIRVRPPFDGTDSRAYEQIEILAVYFGDVLTIVFVRKLKLGIDIPSDESGMSDEASFHLSANY